jgi:predicted ATPase
LIIELRHSFKSLPTFGETELPDFTVVVGLNGAGKSQLLEGIQLGHVHCDTLSKHERGAGEAHPGVVRLTNLSLNLHSEMFVPDIMQTGGEWGEGGFEEHWRRILRQYESHVRSIVKGTTFEKLETREIVTSDWAAVQAMASQASETRVGEFLRQAFDAINETLVNQNTGSVGEAARKAIARCSNDLQREPRLVTYSDAKDFGSWGDYAPFDSRLPRLFAAYRKERLNNARKAGRGGRPAASDWLSKDEFEAAFGVAPWVQLSALLETLGLNYRFAPPGPRDIDPITLHFERLDDEGTHVDFASLSAGEKVLVILAVALLNIDPIRASIQRPELLLLDEIDASLHPTVLHQWIGIIQEKVVGELRIPSILTTHSPITVALTPEGSLFEMSRQSPPLRKASSREVLNKLTVGLPSLEVDFTLRRQVFVEAEVDAQAYDRLYHLLKADIALDKSLNFLSTGIKNKDGVEQGAGCDAVRRIVGELANYGSLSTFGLLDWDGSRVSEGRIVVLGEGDYYAFDNLILHPLLIGLLLIHGGKPPEAGLPRFGGAASLGVEELQRIADSVQGRLSFPNDAPAGSISTHLVGGHKIETRSAFCRSNGHVMEAALMTAFPALKAYSRGQRGKLALAVIDTVLGDYPQFCPEPLAAAFRSLANSHT